MKYNRTEEVLRKQDINVWLENHVKGGKIIFYEEYASIDVNHLRLVIVVEEPEPKSKPKLW